MNQFDKIIILGHTGFLGKGLYRFLQETCPTPVVGYSSARLDLRSSQSPELLKETVTEKSCLVMASAVTREKGDTFETFNHNVKMASHVAQFLERFPVAKCVYLSSISVYGDAETNLAMNERTAVNPDSFYALAKLNGEFILQDVAKRRNFPLLILRIAHVYGPGDTHATYGPMQFIRSLIREKKVYLFGEGEDLRDRIYIDDAVDLTAKLIGTEASGLLNLAAGESCSFQGVVRLLQEIVPYSFEVVSRQRKKPLIHQKFDITKLRKAVPRLVFTEMKPALKATFDAFAAQPFSCIDG